MKSRFFLSGIIFCLVISFSTTIKAQSYARPYSLKIEPGDEFTWRVEIVNKEGWNAVRNESIENIFGASATKEGAEKKIVLTSMGTNEKEGYWIMCYKEWSWTTETFNEKPDIPSSSEKIFNDPAHFKWSSLFCPVPVAEYLDEAASNTVEYNASGTFVEKKDDNLIFVKTYDTFSGILLSYQCKVNETILYQYRAFKTISGYDIPIFSGFITILIVGLACKIKTCKIKKY